MRNITAFLSLVIIFLCAQILPAQEENPYAITVGPQFGFLHGQAEEAVYPDGKIKAELLSHLLWDMKPVLYTGMLLDFSQADPLRAWGFFSNLSLKYGIGGKSGMMEDRDWMSVENSDLTHFSSHDNTTRQLLLFDAGAGFSIPVDSFLLLKLHARFSYMRFSFSGTDGSGTYARGNPPNSGKYHPIDDNPTKIPFTGKVINYSQEWLAVSFGHSLRIYFHNNFYTELSLMISPLVFYSGMDEHLLTKVEYRDFSQGGLFLEPGIALSFSPLNWLTLSLDCSGKYISRTRGDSYNRSIGIGFYEQQGEAGAGLSLLDTRLLITMKGVFQKNKQPYRAVQEE